MQNVICYIGLGSNQLDPKQQLLNAIKAIQSLSDSKFVAQSSFYQSSPLVDKKEHSQSMEETAADYFNAVVKIETGLLPFELLRQLQQIEQQQGRVREPNNRWAPRTLDLDILLYADTVIQTQQLIIPHYAMRQRDFVLKPLLEIAPEVIFQEGVHASHLLQQCDNNNLRKLAGTPKIL